MEMFLFLCFYSTLWRNLIEKISEPQFKRRLIFFASNIYIFIAPGKWHWKGWIYGENDLKDLRSYSSQLI